MAVHHYHNAEYNIMNTLMGGAMADIDYLQTVNIMKAASPYFDSRTRRLVDFIAKVLDAIYSYQKLRLPIDVASQESVNYKLDMEGLLNGIRPHCNDRLRSMVDQILGIFKAKRMYETFQAYSNLMNMMQGSNNSDSDSENSSNSSNNSSNSGIDLSALFGNGLGGNLGNFSVSDIQNMAKAFQFNNTNGNENADTTGSNTDTEAASDKNEDNNGSSNSLSRMIEDLTQLMNASSKDTKETLDSNPDNSEDNHTEHSDYHAFNDSNDHGEDTNSVIEVDFSTGTKSAVKKSNARHPYFYETLEASGILKSDNITDDTQDFNTSDYPAYFNQLNYGDYDGTNKFENAYATYQNIEDASYEENKDNASAANVEMNQNYSKYNNNNNNTESNSNTISSNSDNNNNNNNSNNDNNDNNKDNSSNNNRTANDNVIDLLKTMVPPEQMSTFENLSMLFKAMSYDYNNKNQK